MAPLFRSDGSSCAVFEPQAAANPFEPPRARAYTLCVTTPFWGRIGVT